MADTKITALTALTGADPANDVIPIVDVNDFTMAASGTTKKISVNNILGCSGTATLASATITGDLTVDTNVFKVDTSLNRVGIVTATPRVSLDVASGDIYSSGQITWGGSSPTANQGFLSFTGGNAVIGSTGATALLLYTNGVERYNIGSTGIATWSNVGGVAGTAMTLNSTGLGVGKVPASNQSKVQIYQALGTSLNGALHITDDATTSFVFNNTSSGVSSIWTSGALTFSTGSNAYSTNGARMTLDASGNLLVGKTATNLQVVGCELKADGTVFSTLVDTTNAAASSYQLYSTGAATYRFYVGMGGTVFATNTTISGISDARLKENVQDIDVGLGAILALKPRKFDWKAGKGKDIKGDRGFIAQEFETVFPNLIDEWKDEAPEGEAPYKSVRQDLIPVLVKAIQELAAEVNALKNA